MQGRSISRGIGTGELLVSSEPISFLSGVDPPETGIVVEHGHPLEGQSVAGRVLAFPYGKGSTVGSYVIYALKQNGLAPPPRSSIRRPNRSSRSGGQSSRGSLWSTAFRRSSPASRPAPP